MSTYTTNIPGAPGYAAASALAAKAYANAMGRYQQQRSQTLLKAGYEKRADGSYGVSANNEYGGYQQMLKGEAGQAEGLQRAQAGSGWGDSSGYLGKQRDDLSYAQGGEQAAFGQDLESQLSAITSGEQGAAYDQDAALYQAQQTAAENALAGQQFNPTDYSNLQQPDYGSQTPVKAPPKKTAKPSTHAAGKKRIIAAKQRRAVKSKAKKKGGR